jgi:hypothetical protein
MRQEFGFGSRRGSSIGDCCLERRSPSVAGLLPATAGRAELLRSRLGIRSVSCLAGHAAVRRLQLGGSRSSESRRWT